jgi:hypothetical protein
LASAQTVTVQVNPSRAAFSGPFPRFAVDDIFAKVVEICPDGWSINQRYVTRKGDKYFLNVDVQCSAPVASIDTTQKH